MRSTNQLPLSQTSLHPRNPRVSRWAWIFLQTIRDSHRRGTGNCAPAFVFCNSGLGLPAKAVKTSQDGERVGCRGQNEYCRSPGVRGKITAEVSVGAQSGALVFYVSAFVVGILIQPNSLSGPQFDVDLMPVVFRPRGPRQLFLCGLQPACRWNVAISHRGVRWSEQPAEDLPICER